MGHICLVSADTDPSLGNHVLSLSGTQLDSEGEKGSRAFPSHGSDCDSPWVPGEILRLHSWAWLGVACWASWVSVALLPGVGTAPKLCPLQVRCLLSGTPMTAYFICTLRGSASLETHCLTRVCSNKWILKSQRVNLIFSVLTKNSPKQKPEGHKEAFGGDGYVYGIDFGDGFTGINPSLNSSNCIH